MSGTRATSLFQRVLGSEFKRLPEQIRSLHACATSTLAEGRCTVNRGSSFFARLAARLLSVPPQCRDEKIQVLIRPQGDHEIWTRVIAGQRFVSALRASGSRRVTETIGPAAFEFDLVSGRTGLTMVLQGVRVIGLPLPQPLWPGIAARQSVENGLYRFDIATSLPGIGPVVAYSGTLAAVEDGPRVVLGWPVVLFDGICNYCNRGVDFLLRWEPDGVIRFAAMQSEPGRRLIKNLGLPERDFETFVVVDGDQVLTKSTAILHLVRYLGRPWRLAYVFRLAPRAIRDAVYDVIARNRYKWMGTRANCRMPTPEERERFLT